LSVKLSDRNLIVLLGAVALAVALGGCASPTNEPAATAATKKNDLFATPDWVRGSTTTKKMLTDRTITPDDLIGADGSCAATRVAMPEPPPQPLPETDGTNPPSEPASLTPDSTQPQPWQGPTVMGGIALAMTECDVAQRAGFPTNIEIGADPSGERSVTLTYMQGPWPGLYRFRAGRLVSIERVVIPEPPKPKKPERSKRKPTAVRVAPR